MLAEGAVYEAASLLVDVWTIEQQHEQRSPYRYSELPRNGVGPPTGFTGMTWSGFRPSDDQQQYGYNVPVNMCACAYAAAMHQQSWMPASAAGHNSFATAVDSDAACRYAYAALQRALELNRNIWRSDSFEQRATALAEGIRQGVRAKHFNGSRIQSSCNPMAISKISQLDS